MKATRWIPASASPVCVDTPDGLVVIVAGTENAGCVCLDAHHRTPGCPQGCWERHEQRRGAA
jgi:hypothetical protein